MIVKSSKAPDNLMWKDNKHGKTEKPRKQMLGTCTHPGLRDWSYMSDRMLLQKGCNSNSENDKSISAGKPEHDQTQRNDHSALRKHNV